MLKHASDRERSQRQLQPEVVTSELQVRLARPQEPPRAEARGGDENAARLSCDRW